MDIDVKTLLRSELPPGPQGIQGVQGPQGTQGIQGNDGQSYNQGIQGIQGTQAAQGIQGRQGIQGQQGIQGTQGIQGIAGSFVAQGIQGTQGIQGISGQSFNQGIQGAQGSQGAQGIQGISGQSFNQGIQGTQGIQGNDGAFVAQGIQGTQGIQGILGRQGIQGSQGATGSQGIQGTSGSQGVQGITGMIASWVIKTSNYTASIKENVVASTISGSWTLTLPPSPPPGAYVTLADGYDWQTNNLIVARNGSTIESLAEDLILDIAAITIDLIYDGSTWQVYAFAAAGGTSVAITNDTSTNITQYPIMARQTTGDVSTGYVSSSKLYFNPSTGDLSATNFDSLSDGRLKESVNSLDTDYILETLNKINPVSFSWKDTKIKSYGVIAQEIEQILPELVKVNDQDQKTVSYIPLIAFLIEAVKKLNQDVNSLKNARNE